MINAMNMLKPAMRKLILSGILAAALSAVLVSRREVKVSMGDLDWLDGAGLTAPRRYRSPGHLLRHLGDLAGNIPAIARVYALRAISPAFREQIMIVTAMANDCSA